MALQMILSLNINQKLLFLPFISLYLNYHNCCNIKWSDLSFYTCLYLLANRIHYTFNYGFGSW